MNHQNWNNIIDEPEDKEEYVEVTEPHEIQSILKAEEELKAKRHEQSILNIIDEKPTSSPNQPTNSRPNKPNLKFISDDRQRVYPATALQPSQQNKKQIGKASNEKQAGKKDHGVEKKSKYVAKEQTVKAVEVKKEDEKQPFNHGSQKKEISRKQVFPIKKEQESSLLNQSKKRYAEKKSQKLSQKLKRKQQQTINGQQIELQLLRDDEQYDNQIYIGKRDIDIYFGKAKELIQQHDFIVLKSYAFYVSKAFSVAGLMAREFPQLKQISVPSTVEVKETSSKGLRNIARGSIRIQLSLHELDKNHVGYQQVKKVQAPKKQESKPEYRQKQEPKKYEGKSNYKGKQHERQSRKYRQKSSSDDERRLR